MVISLFGTNKKSSSLDWIVVFLGNPGDKYENTRHNVGFMTADALGEKLNKPIQRLKFKALTNVVEYGGCAKGTTITVDTVRLHYDEITIKGSYSATAYETEVAGTLLSRGLIKSEDYVSGVYSLEQTKEALEAHMNGKGVKFLIKP